MENCFHVHDFSKIGIKIGERGASQSVFSQLRIQILQ